ncbi:DUF362 domain-containing protein [Patescibacteria group bacterium]|nr:DUF362 domain-containing protein [Patescibacteria group bacterium]
MESEKTTVIVVTGHDRREMVREAITKLGEAWETKVKEAGQIFVHPNLVSFHRPTANANAEAVRGVLDHLSLLTADEVLVGDAGVRNTKKSFKKLGYETLSRSGNIRLVDLNDDDTVESYAYRSDMTKRPLGFSKTTAEADLNIVVVPAKMHSYYIVTLSIKTHVVGSQVVKASPLGLHMRWPWLHTGYVPAHHTLADVYADHPAQLAIIDGTQAMEGEGPASGETVDLGWVVVSFNPVAADAVAAYLMGIEPSEVGYLYHLNAKGLGPIEMAELVIDGPKLDALRRELKRPSSYPSILEWK